MPTTARPNVNDERPPLPVIVIGGYLGAGKTTLVNHLLRHAEGRRIAVLVNDFGEAAIDADLIAQAQGSPESGVLSLAGGCLCCSFGDDLVGTLGRLADRDPAPDLVLIELSGVAVPGPVLRTLGLQPRVQAAGTWVVVDQAQIQRLARDRYLGDVVRGQLHDADWLVLNKPDLADAALRAALPDWLAQASPRARVLDAAVHSLPPALVLGWRLGDQGGAEAMPGDDEAGHADGAEVFARRTLRRPAVTPVQAAQALFASRSLPLPDGTPLPALAAALARPDSGVWRAKGLARDGQGRGWLLQVAGDQWQVVPAAVHGPGRLVVIGRRGVVDAPGFSLPAG